jgi:citrate lyase subunit beta/citryl-CoA lyase
MENNKSYSYHYLYVPGNKLEFIDKAIKKGVRNLIIDFEDSVPMNEKDIVRKNVCEFISNHEIDINISVRINSDNEIQKKDIESLLSNSIKNIFVPKLETNSSIIKEKLGDEFDSVIGIIETASGLNNLVKITDKIKLNRAAIGEVDFSADLGIEETSESLLFYRSQLVFISKSLDLKKPIAGVYKNINDLEGLKEFALYVKKLGFGGMQAIHPTQVEIIEKTFRPTQDEISDAVNLLQEIELNNKKGIGVFVDSSGSIVDAAMIKKAEEIITQSE